MPNSTLDPEGELEVLQKGQAHLEMLVFDIWQVHSEIVGTLYPEPSSGRRFSLAQGKPRPGRQALNSASCRE